VAYWEKGPPPIVRMQGEEVYWKGAWVQDGPVTFFGKRGEIEGKGSYRLGLEEGEWTLMENGIRATGSFVAGKREGPWVYAYPSGRPQETGSYLAGKRDGEWRTYYTNGDLKTLTVYQDGKVQGPVQRWDSNGLPQ